MDKGLHLHAIHLLVLFIWFVFRFFVVVVGWMRMNRSLYNKAQEEDNPRIKDIYRARWRWRNRWTFFVCLPGSESLVAFAGWIAGCAWIHSTLYSTQQQQPSHRIPWSRPEGWANGDDRCKCAPNDDFRYYRILYCCRWISIVRGWYAHVCLRG